MRRLAAVFDVVSSEKLRLGKYQSGSWGVSLGAGRTFVGRNVETTSLRLDTELVAPPRDRWMLREEPFDAPRSGRSRSIGVDDMAIEWMVGV